MEETAKDKRGGRSINLYFCKPKIHRYQIYIRATELSVSCDVKIYSLKRIICDVCRYFFPTLKGGSYCLATYPEVIFLTHSTLFNYSMR